MIYKEQKAGCCTTDTLGAADKVARVELIQEQLAFLGYQVQLTGQVLSNGSRPVSLAVFLASIHVPGHGHK